ncbi:MAG TPA: hypothetical protein VFQ44_01735 [Streptosporangiaceae bacterium]|nr:hypothetical protein [Streptosporangiaceae bacterium]
MDQATAAVIAAVEAEHRAQVISGTVYAVPGSGEHADGPGQIFRGAQGTTPWTAGPHGEAPGCRVIRDNAGDAIGVFVTHQVDTDGWGQVVSLGIAYLGAGVPAALAACAAAGTAEAARAVADKILGLGTGRREHCFIARADHEPLLEALRALGAEVTSTSGTVSFVHGTYTAPWTKDVITGAGYDLTISWSRNAATGADNGVRVAGECPQWRVNRVACWMSIAGGDLSGAEGRARLAGLASSSPHPEEAHAAEVALRLLDEGAVPRHRSGLVSTAGDFYPAFARACAGTPAGRPLPGEPEPLEGWEIDLAAGKGR